MYIAHAYQFTEVFFEINEVFLVGTRLVPVLAGKQKRGPPKGDGPR